MESAYIDLPIKGDVILTANTTNNILWYQNGEPLTGGNKNDNPLTVTDETSAGEWFAVVTDGTCSSIASNVLTLIDNTSGSTALVPPVMYIDGLDISGGTTPTLCIGSSVILEVKNANVYPAGVFFEWFINGVSQGITTSPSMVYNIPNGTTSMSVSVQASNQGVNCPSTALAPMQTITFTAPSNTLINNGASIAHICGGSPALLVAANQTGVAYEWYHNDVLIPSATTANYQASAIGKYRVRYQSSKGCWSKLSTAITVENSSAISMSWGMEPGDANDEVIYSANESYSVQTAPVADSYTWKALRADGTTEITMYPSGNGSVATITYPDLGSPTQETITISCVAKNGCGQTTISKPVTLRPGCSPVTSVSITPDGSTKMTVGDNMLFTATSAGATDYQWQVNGVNVGSNQATHTYTANTAGIYTLSVKAQGCGGDATASVTIEVQPDLGDIEEEVVNGNYTLTGQICYDVNQTSTTACGPTSSRKNDFASTKTFYYSFNNTTAYTDLAFYFEDNSAVLAQPTGHSVSGKVLSVIFRSDIEQHIKNNGDAVLTIYAVYKNASGQLRKIKKEIKIQDCSCCGAYVDASTWLTFKCHNEGADESLDPFPAVLTAGYHGNYYQWGRTTVVANASTSSGSISGWNTTHAPNNSWNDTNKRQGPCPAGFRLPSKAEWDGIVGQTSLNAQSSIGTWSNTATNYSAGRYLGTRLLLPVAGLRNTINGQLYNRGHYGYYWSSTEYSNGNSAYCMNVLSSTAAVGTTPRSYGFSVRCVAE